jgi:hypothetical protein
MIDVEDLDRSVLVPGGPTEFGPQFFPRFGLAG